MLVLCACMNPRRPPARRPPAIFFPARGKKGKFGAIFVVLGLRRGWGGVQGLPTGVRAGEKISEACPCRSARPRAAAPLQKFCAALCSLPVRPFRAPCAGSLCIAAARAARAHRSRHDAPAARGDRAGRAFDDVAGGRPAKAVEEPDLLASLVACAVDAPRACWRHLLCP